LIADFKLLSQQQTSGQSPTPTHSIRGNKIFTGQLIIGFFSNAVIPVLENFQIKPLTVAPLE